jgi:hypothetical protein
MALRSGREADAPSVQMTKTGPETSALYGL